MQEVRRSALADLVPPGQPQCDATPPGLTDWPRCARPPDNHAGKGGRHESANYAWNDTGWFAVLIEGIDKMILRAAITKSDGTDNVNVHADHPHLLSAMEWLHGMLTALHTNEEDAVSFLITILPRHKMESDVHEETLPGLDAPASVRPPQM